MERSGVGIYPTLNKRFFNAGEGTGIDLYQRWILYQKRAYRDLTTSVHANTANRDLRNDFRTAFQIDCVYFRPDETCADYVDEGLDWWLAITHWDNARVVGHGFSKAVTSLKWCVVGPDSFQADGRGYKASLHKRVSASHGFVPGHYSSLEVDIMAAYHSKDQKVVVCDFN